MKIGTLLACLASSVLLVACGGDTKASPHPSPSEASASKDADDGGSTSRSSTTDDAQAQDPQGTGKEPRRRIRRPRVNVQLVKALFGNDPASAPAKVASTPALVALGRSLYHAEVLSADGGRSCASCHPLGSYGVDGAKSPAGVDGGRNAPTTFNAARHFRQFWDGRAESVEQVAGADGHATADMAAVVARVKADDGLAAGFAKAFAGQDEPVTAENFGHAVGAFQRTLVTKSKWDAYLDGDQKAMSNEELLGLKTFMDVGCTQCHMTRMLGGHTYQKLGVLKPYSGKDTGRMQVTGEESDRYLFKVPSLANVAKTAPYYHDGSIATLAEAVVAMADNQLNKKLKQEQVDAIVAFLEATTGELPKDLVGK
ncbi:MAG: c-type cytochrome [Planctomycetes bacterium]|nr:c-type cytochrome [Planctomycetota bacterium]